MNKIILIGRLTKEPELRHTTSNIEVTQFSLAVNRDFKNQEGEYEADFINCVAYRKLAETISVYVRKGDKLAVTGRLQVRNYDNSEGKKVYVSEVIVDSIEFLESKKESIDEPKEEMIPQEEENDPFASFGNQMTITEDALPW